MRASRSSREPLLSVMIALAGALARSNQKAGHTFAFGDVGRALTSPAGLPEPQHICSGTRVVRLALGGARGPRPCSESSRVIWALVLATSAQYPSGHREARRMGPKQRGQVSTLAAKTTLGSP